MEGRQARLSLSPPQLEGTQDEHATMKTSKKRQHESATRPMMIGGVKTACSIMVENRNVERLAKLIT